MTDQFTIQFVFHQERGYGRIVNIASNAAIGTALPATTFYAATKAEVLILTRRFAMELGRRGITVNAVAPGWIVTEMASAGLKLIDCRFSAVVVALIVGRNPAWTKVPVDLGRALTTVRQY